MFEFSLFLARNGDATLRSGFSSVATHTGSAAIDCGVSRRCEALQVRRHDWEGRGTLREVAAVSPASAGRSGSWTWCWCSVDCGSSPSSYLLPFLLPTSLLPSLPSTYFDVFSSYSSHSSGVYCWATVPAR